MASLFSPSLSFSLHHFPQPKSTNLSPRSNQPALLRVSIRHRFNSNLHKIACTKTPQFFLQSIAKGSALFLVGSYLFLGQFHFKSVLAIVTPQSSNISSPLEEKSNTRKEKEEKEKKDKKKNKKYDEVLEMYERFLDKNPMDVGALKIVLYGKLRKGKMEEALEYIKRLGLAMVMHKNHEGPASIEMLNEALELACRENRVTEERNIKILIAMMHIVKGDLDGALKKFEDMTNEDLKDFRPYLCKGILYSLLDKKKEADEQLQIYKSLVPDEFPQRGYLEDCIRTAKTDSHDRLHKDFFSDSSFRT